MTDWTGKRALVLGLGKSGRSVVRFLAERGAHVVAADERSGETLDDLESLPESVELHVGQPLPDPDGYDLVVPSPGIPVHRWHDTHGGLTAGDIELSGRHLQVPIAAVTGTNGKSTTVALLEAMLRAAGLRAIAGGNLGLPALELVAEPLDVAVLEVSSFQLESTSTFRPHVAAVLNVTPDHLDRHGDLATYAATKAKLLAHQTPDDYAILNVDDPIVCAMADATQAQVVRMSTRGVPAASAGEDRQAWIDGSTVVLADHGGLRRISLDGLRLAGRHNLENVLAAFAMVWCLDADIEAATQALLTFEALPHRCEVVARSQGVTWVDDSKATNVGAAAKALAAFSEPVVWIVGGRGKGADFAELASVASTHARVALLVGEAADALASVLTGRVECEHAGSIEHAVRRASELAKPGDVVLLAPACASFDQYPNFEARGDAFQSQVEEVLHEGRAK